MVINEGKSRKFRILATVGVLVTLAILPLDRKWFQREIFNLYDKFHTYDPGFSSWDAMGKDSFSSVLRLLKKSPSILYGMTFGYPERPQLEHLIIDIKFDYYQKILEDRAKAISVGVLVDPTFVKAKIRRGGEIYNVKLRLKGDLGDHWRSVYRMSFRVNVKGKKSILGFKKFSLQKPSSRAHPMDQAFQSVMRRTGNLASTYDYARVTVNGTDWGVMLLEEHMSKELLEKQQAKESLLVKFGNDDRWHYNYTASEPFRGYRLSDPRMHLGIYGQKKYLSQLVYRKYYTYIMQHRLLEDSVELYDIDAFSRALLVSAIWNQLHGLHFTNSRYYFNPYTLKLEPVTTDQGRFHSFHDGLFGGRPLDSDNVYRNILRAEQFQSRLSENLTKVTQAYQGLPALFAKFHKYLPIEPLIDAGIALDNLSQLSASPRLYLSELIKENRRQKEPAHVNEDHVADMPRHLRVLHYADGRLELYNLLPVPVKVIAIYLDGHKVSDQSLLVPAFDIDNPYLPSTIDTRLTGIMDRRVEVETRLLGHARRNSVGPTLLTSGTENPLLRPISEKLPYLHRNGAQWAFVAGDWTVDQPLTVPGTLTIPAGTRLRFAEDAYLIVRGAIRAEGRKDRPIRLEPKNETWKGIYVVEATTPSLLRHVLISKTQSLQDELLYLTGGVTFYRSDVTLDRVQLHGATGEDALNIVKSNYVIRNSLIQGSYSDGFDSDFSKGEIIASGFRGIGGDAVDFSGSEVTIRDLTAEDIQDKAISVGEGSTATVLGGVFRNVGVGIASKDGSQVKGENVRIESYRLHAAMTYIKKDFYGQPSMELQEPEVAAGDAYSRQFGSEFTVDGTEIEARKLDVKQLYRGEVMRK